MNELIVINTGPLITLARIEALDVAGQLPFTFICPEEVRAELAEGENAGHPRVAPPWLTVCPLCEHISLVALSALDRGEAAVIQLALERSIPLVCIDEWKGRRAALAVGLKVVGVLGLLGKAKLLGLLPAVRPFVKKAVQNGIRYDSELVERLLESVGEPILNS
jgi:predicted nucleic acid-binding protein